MKFWELFSICRAQPKLVRKTAAQNLSWSQFETRAKEINRLADIQDRAKLDLELPDDFVTAVLERCSVKFFVGDDGYLRSYRFHADDEQLCALDAYLRFGHLSDGGVNVLEEALEKGAILVGSSRGHTQTTGPAPD
jgi:hypothetical protein